MSAQLVARPTVWSGVLKPQRGQPVPLSRKVGTTSAQTPAPQCDPEGSNCVSVLESSVDIPTGHDIFTFCEDEATDDLAKQVKQLEEEGFCS